MVIKKFLNHIYFIKLKTFVNSTRANKVLRLFFTSLYCISIIFAIFLIRNLLQSVSVEVLDHSSELILKSIGLYSVAVLSHFFAWAWILSFYKKVDWGDFAIYMKTIALRVIPGGIWDLLGRSSEYSKKKRITGKDIARIAIVEWMILICIGASIFVYSNNNLDSIIKNIAFFIILPLILYISNFFFPASIRTPFYRKGKFAYSIVWALLYTVGWLAAILIFIFTTKAIAPEALLTTRQLVEIWSISATLSLVTKFLPINLGFRELTLWYLLNPFMSLEKALSIGILIRLIYAMADITIGIIGWLLGIFMVRLNKKLLKA